MVIIETVKSFFFLIVCVFTAVTVLSQSFVYRHYTRDNGLAGNMVYCSSQDKDGFIWFGTENGASRFDGKNFVNFTTEDGLTDNEVLEVYSDKKGRTWFICFTGGLCYYYKGKIYSHKNDKNIPENLVLSKRSFSGFYEDNLGTVWFLSESLWGYNENKKFIPFIPEIANENSSKLYHIQVLRDSGKYNLAILIAERFTDTGTLYRYDSLGTYKRKINNIRIFSQDLGNTNIFRKQAIPGLNLFNIKGNTVTLFKIRNDSVIIEYNKNLQWDITRSNYNYTTGVQIISTYKHGVQEVNDAFEVIGTELLNEKISSTLIDENNNRWFSTLGNGVFFRSKSAIRYYSERDELKSNDIKVIHFINNRIYLGFKEGITQELVNNTFYNKSVIPAFNRSFNNIKGVYQNSKGELFFCSDRSVARINKAGAISYYNIGGSSVKDFSVVNDSILLFTSHSGTYLVSPQGKIDTLIHRKRGTTIESANLVGFSHYIATIDTLFYLDTSKRLNHISLYDFKKWGRISDLKYLKNGKLIIATYNHGIKYLYNDSLFSINNINGLISNQIRKLYIDSFQHIWAISDLGISKIILNRKNEIQTCLNYTQSDGFSTALINDMCINKDTIYLATDNGLNFFHENQLSKDPDHSVQITSFLVNNIPVELASKKLTANYGNNIKIKFNGISYSSSDFLTYRYFLTGDNPEGTITSLNEIELPALLPGSYSFKVLAINKNNIESKDNAIIIFEILPAWWQTWRFKALMGLISCLAIYYVFKYRIKRIKKDEAEKTSINKQFAELKLEAVRSQMDPHFIFNCLNAIQHFNIKEDYKSAQYFMAEFAKLIRKTLNHSHRDFVLLADEIDLLEIYIKLEKLRYEDLITYSITLTQDVKQQAGELLVPSLIFQPYVENAINHGLKYLKDGGGKLILNFEIQNNRLFVTLDDNGIGINKSKKLKEQENKSRTSFGISLSESHINVINKIHDLDIACTIIDKSALTPSNQGTLVQLSLPIKQKNV